MVSERARKMKRREEKEGGGWRATLGSSSCSSGKLKYEKTEGETEVCKKFMPIISRTLLTCKRELLSS